MRDYINNPPWDEIKQWAKDAGFTEDDYGDPKCSEWDNLRYFADMVAKDAVEKYKESLTSGQQ
jgi:hypothetical protein